MHLLLTSLGEEVSYWMLSGLTRFLTSLGRSGDPGEAILMSD